MAINTSPAFTLNREHPTTGREYAEYLHTVAQHFQLPVRTGVEVFSVEALPDEAGFVLATSQGAVRGRFARGLGGRRVPVPARRGLPGAEHCLHTSAVRSWREVAGDDFVIIGGFESGMDAAFHLTRFQQAGPRAG